MYNIIKKINRNTERSNMQVTKDSKGTWPVNIHIRKSDDDKFYTLMSTGTFEGVDVMASTYLSLSLETAQQLRDKLIEVLK
jgi:hypothetical protein